MASKYFGFQYAPFGACHLELGACYVIRCLLFGIYLFLPSCHLDSLGTAFDLVPSQFSQDKNGNNYTRSNCREVRHHQCAYREHLSHHQKVLVLRSRDLLAGIGPVDASQKLKTLTSRGEAKGEIGDLTIKVAIDKDKGTLTISDRGIGLTADEVEKYINQIAFSGAEEFVEKYKKEGDGNQIIGHFGMGFYSAFMVADKVELISKSFQEGAESVKWVCEGSTSYEISAGDRTDRGTDIVLHIAEESTEFLEENRVRGILNKYCKFLPVEIQFGEHEVTEGEGDDAVKEMKPSIVNNTTPAWTKAPKDLKDEDYAGLHSDLYPMTEPPLFHIHLNVDPPFRLTGILNFPKLKENFDMQKNKVQLYSNQVFVTDDVSSVMPEFLTMLNGVIDSPDIPLNVSRSYLQSDANVKRISGHITRKVADKLDSMFKKDRADLEAKWNDVKLIIEYGMLTDEKFFDKAQKFALYPNTDQKHFTLEEHIEGIKAAQTDKNERTVILYASNLAEQHSYIAQAKERG